jgi:hypothetical protein
MSRWVNRILKLFIILAVLDVVFLWVASDQFDTYGGTSMWDVAVYQQKMFAGWLFGTWKLLHSLG